jgi:hypothetical protein
MRSETTTLRGVAGKRAWLIVIAAMAAMLSAQGATRSLTRLVDAVLRRGPDSQLPAKLSAVLGLGALEKPTPVKQAVMRDGYRVRTFNVCAANHDDIVLITYNEQSRSSKAYLTSPAGDLRKAVYYQAGAPADVRSPADARSGFADEVKFWTDFEGAPGALK